MRSSTRMKKIIKIWAVGFKTSPYCWKCMVSEFLLSTIPYATARVFSEIINGVMEIRGFSVMLLFVGLYAILQFFFC